MTRADVSFRGAYALFVLVGLLTASGAQPSDRARVPAAPPQTTSSPNGFRYTGPGSCSAPSCHGGVQPRQKCRVWQNEYGTWAVQDKHSRAYRALTTPVSQRMGRILGIPQPESASKCLACHSLNISQEQRCRSFDSSDGVSCECCHGPAEVWLGLHTTQEWCELTAKQKADKGMYDTKDLISRSERCLTCHLGNKEKFVDHEMIAAGHPDLYFELDSFSAVMPRHWPEPLGADRCRNPVLTDRPLCSPWISAQSWGTGQAVQLREDLNRLTERTKGKIWPEYSELDCFACHHSLTDAKDSWRQKRGYPGRQPGNPPWNMSCYVVFRQLAGEVDTEPSRHLEAGMNQLFTQMSQLMNNRDAIASTAQSSADLTKQLAARIKETQFDAALTLRLLRSISADSIYIAGQGERAAEQAAMAIDSLFIAYTQNASVGNAQQVRDPSAYNQYTFEEKMRTVNALLQ